MGKIVVDLGKVKSKYNSQHFNQLKNKGEKISKNKTRTIEDQLKENQKANQALDKYRIFFSLNKSFIQNNNF